MGRGRKIGMVKSLRNLARNDAKMKGKEAVVDKRGIKYYSVDAISRDELKKQSDKKKQEQGWENKKEMKKAQKAKKEALRKVRSCASCVHIAMCKSQEARQRNYCQRWMGGANEL